MAWVTPKIDWLGGDIPDVDDYNNIGNNLQYLRDNRPIIGGGSLFNSNFLVNQRSVAGSVVLAAGEYGHDRWKGGSSGCSYTFSTTANLTTITISAGSLIQVIEGKNLVSDDYILSWVGTADGKIGAGGFGTTPQTASVTGGSDLSIEFDTGTLITPKFEIGDVETVYIIKDIGLVSLDCKRYTQLVSISLDSYRADTNQVMNSGLLGQDLRTSPTVIALNNIYLHNNDDSTTTLLTASGGSITVNQFRPNLVVLSWSPTITDNKSYNINSSVTNNNKLATSGSVLLDSEI